MTSKADDLSKAWEKWAHWVLSQHYDIDSISEENDPMLRLYLLKAQKLEERYAMGYSSSVLGSMYEQQLLEELAAEEEMKDNQFSLNTSQTQIEEVHKPLLKRLSFPFDQVSEGIFLAYLMEVLCGQQKDTYVSMLKQDITYEIQMLKNLGVLLKILREEFAVEVDEYDITEESLMKDVNAVNDLFSLLFDTFVLNSDKIKWNDQIGEHALLEWCRERVEIYPNQGTGELDFDEGFYNGVAFCYIIHSYSPEHIKLHLVNKHDPQNNLQQAFEVSFFQYNVPHVIQNFHINRSTIILYLSLLFSQMTITTPSNFDSREISGAVRRKILYMKKQQEYIDDAMRIADVIKDFDGYLKKIDTKAVLKLADVNVINDRFRIYKREKSRIGNVIFRLYEHEHNLKLLTKCVNRFKPYDPPSYLSIPRLVEAFQNLTQPEMRFVSAVFDLFANAELYSTLQKIYENQADTIAQQLAHLRKELEELDQEDEPESLPELHSRHDTLISISVSAGQLKGKFENLTVIYNQLLNKQMIESENSSTKYRTIESNFSDFIHQIADDQLMYENLMEREIQLEIMRAKYRITADDFGLVIARCIQLLSYKNMDQEFFIPVIKGIETILPIQAKKIRAIVEEERKINEASEEDVDLPSASELERFLGDLKLILLKKDKEISADDSVQGESRRKYEDVENMINNFLRDIDQSAAMVQKGLKENGEKNSSNRLLFDQKMQLLKSSLPSDIQHLKENMNADVDYSLVSNDHLSYLCNCLANIVDGLIQLTEPYDTVMRPDEKRLVIKDTEGIMLLFKEYLCLILSYRVKAYKNKDWEAEDISGIVSDIGIDNERSISDKSAFESNIIPNVHELIQKFDSKIPILLEKVANLDIQMNEKQRNIAGILNAISELKADVHYFNVFKTVVEEFVTGMDEDTLNKWHSMISQFEEAQAQVDLINNRIKDELQEIFKKHEYILRYRKLANETLQLLEDAREKLTEPDGDVTDVDSLVNSVLTNITELQNMINEHGKTVDLPCKGELSIEHLTELLKHVQELYDRLKEQSEGHHKRKDYLDNLIAWFCSQIEFVERWCVKVESLITASDIDSIDSLNLLKRQVEHAIQERTLVGRVLLEELSTKVPLLIEYCNADYEATVRDLLDLYNDLLPKLEQVLSVVVEQEREYLSRVQYEEKIRLEVDRLKSFIIILSAKQIDRNVNFLGKLPISLITSFMQDCSTLFDYRNNIGQITRSNPLLTDSRLILSIDTRISLFVDEFENLVKQFESLYYAIVNQLENYYSIESEMNSLVNEYSERSKELFQQITEYELYIQQNGEELSTMSQSQKSLDRMAPNFEELRILDQKIASRGIQTIPLDIIQAKLKRLRQPAHIDFVLREIKIDDKSRERQLKYQIFELVKEVTNWMDVSLSMENRFKAISTNLPKTEQYLQSLIEIQNQEGDQYNKLIKAVSLHSELALMSMNSADLDEIITTVERKWIHWTRKSRTMIQRVEDQLETLFLNEERKKHFQEITNRTLDIWMEQCAGQLEDMIASDINNRTRLRLELEKLNNLKNQREAMKIIFDNMRYVYSQIAHPDKTISKYQHEVNIKWSKIGDELQKKEKMLSRIQEVLGKAREEKLLMENKNEEFLAWVSVARQFLVKNLKSLSSNHLKECILKMDRQIKTEALKILQFLQQNSNSIHLQLTENHWKVFLFLFDRFRQRTTDVEHAEALENDKIQSFESKVNEKRAELELTMNKVKALKRESEKSAEADTKLEGVIEYYSEIRRITAEYCAALNTFEDINPEKRDVAIEFEEAALEAFSTLENVFTFLAQDFDTLKKSEGISTAYFALYTTISSWEELQRNLFYDLDEKKESVDTIASTEMFYNNYFAQRPLISAVYKQLSGIWSKLTAMGIVLQKNLKTPGDIKKSIEQLDYILKKKLVRANALVEQFNYALSIREQWLESASSLASWIRKELDTISNFSDSITSDEGMKSDLDEVKELKEKQPSTESTLLFLEDLQHSMLDQCMLLPQNWDEYLVEILEQLRQDVSLLSAGIQAREIHLTQNISSLMDFQKIQERFIATLKYVNAATEKLKNNADIISEKGARVSNEHKVNYLKQIESQVANLSPKIVRLLALYDFMQQISFKKPMKSSVRSSLQNYRQLRDQLEVDLIELTGDYSGLSSILSGDISDAETLINLLYLNWWLTVSNSDLALLFDSIAEVENLPLATIRNNLTTMNIFKKEMDMNKPLLDEICASGTSVSDAQTLKQQWQDLEDVYHAALNRLSQLMVEEIEKEKEKRRQEAVKSQLDELQQKYGAENGTQIVIPRDLDLMDKLLEDLKTSTSPILSPSEIRAIQSSIDKLRPNSATSAKQQKLLSEMLHSMEKRLIDTYSDILNCFIVLREVDVKDPDEIQVKQLVSQAKQVSGKARDEIQEVIQIVNNIGKDPLITLVVQFVDVFAEKLDSSSGLVGEAFRKFNESRQINLPVVNAYKKLSEEIGGILDNIERQISENVSGGVESKLEEREILPVQISSSLGRSYMEEIKAFKDPLVSKFEETKRLYYSLFGLKGMFIQLQQLYLEKLNIESQQSIVHLETEQDSVLWKRWGAICKRIQNMLHDPSSIDIDRCIKSVEQEYSELVTWFQEGEITIQKLPSGKSYYDAQLALLEIGLLRIQFEHCELRYSKFVSDITESHPEYENMKQELTRARHEFKNRIQEIPSREEMSRIVRTHQAFESLLQTYATNAEELHSFLNTVQIECNTVRDSFALLVNDDNNLKSLKQKQIETKAHIGMLQLLEKRLEVIRPLLDTCDTTFRKIVESDISDISFTDHIPSFLSNQFDQVAEAILELTEDIEELSQVYSDHTQHSLEYIQKYNSLYFWIQRSFVLLSPEKTKVLDSVSMVQLLAELCQEWKKDYMDTYKSEYKEILNVANSALAVRGKNDSSQHFLQMSIDLYGIVDLETLKKNWVMMESLQKNRIDGLDREERERVEIQQRYHLPKEIVDVVHSTFVHFSRNNRTTQETSTVLRVQVVPLLVSLGLDIPKEKERGEVMTIFAYVTPENASTAEMLAFDDLMKYLSDLVIKPVTNASDMMIVLNNLVSKYPMRTWEDLKTTLGSSLPTRDINIMYTMIRFTSSGMDLNRLCEEVFSS